MRIVWQLIEAGIQKRRFRTESRRYFEPRPFFGEPAAEKCRLLQTYIDRQKCLLEKLLVTAWQRWQDRLVEALSPPTVEMLHLDEKDLPKSAERY
jgi:hypothetical protein